MGPFWALFPNFWAKIFFPENPALSRTTSYEFLAPCQISEKTNDTIPRKCLDKRIDGRTDRPYFIGPFRLPPGVQIMMKLFLEREMSHDQNLTSNSPSPTLTFATKKDTWQKTVLQQKHDLNATQKYT